MKKLFLITTLISQFVFARASEPAKFDGAYLMKLKIGDRIFEDQLTIKAENEEAVISVNSYNGSIAGELIVPGTFTSPVIGQAVCVKFESQCKLKFEITANENGQSYKVFYEASVAGHDYHLIRHSCVKPHFSGQATLEDGSVLGTFLAEQVSQ